MDNIKSPKELLEFMSGEINYGYLGKNGKIYDYNDDNYDSDWFEQYVLESKEELLNNLYGNCWDQVEFERDWFLDNKYEIKTIFEMVLLDYDNPYPTHSFLAYKDENGFWCWFENADLNNRGIHKFETFDKLLNYQYNCYVAFLKTYNISSEEISKTVITEFDKPKKHISAKDYLDHVLNSKQITLKNKGADPNE